MKNLSDMKYKNTFYVKCLNDVSCNLTKNQIYHAREGCGLNEGMYYICETSTYYSKYRFGYVRDRIESKDSHYKESIEPIDLIEAFNLNFSRANVIKYVARAGRKDDELQDLKKAKWYLEREIKRLEDGRE